MYEKWQVADLSSVGRGLFPAPPHQAAPWVGRALGRVRAPGVSDCVQGVCAGICLPPPSHPCFNVKSTGCHSGRHVMQVPAAPHRAAPLLLILSPRNCSKLVSAVVRACPWTGTFSGWEIEVLLGWCWCLAPEETPSSPVLTRALRGTGSAPLLRWLLCTHLSWGSQPPDSTWFSSSRIIATLLAHDNPLSGLLVPLGNYPEWKSTTDAAP